MACGWGKLLVWIILIPSCSSIHDFDRNPDITVPVVLLEKNLNYGKTDQIHFVEIDRRNQKKGTDTHLIQDNNINSLKSRIVIVEPWENCKIRLERERLVPGTPFSEFKDIFCDENSQACFKTYEANEVMRITVHGPGWKRCRAAIWMLTLEEKSPKCGLRVFHIANEDKYPHVRPLFVSNTMFFGKMESVPFCYYEVKNLPHLSTHLRYARVPPSTSSLYRKLPDVMFANLRRPFPVHRPENRMIEPNYEHKNGIVFYGIFANSNYCKAWCTREVVTDPPKESVAELEKIPCDKLFVFKKIYKRMPRQREEGLKIDHIQEFRIAPTHPARLNIFVFRSNISTCQNRPICIWAKTDPGDSMYNFHTCREVPTADFSQITNEKIIELEARSVVFRIDDYCVRVGVHWKRIYRQELFYEWLHIQYQWYNFLISLVIEITLSIIICVLVGFWAYTKVLNTAEVTPLLEELGYTNDLQIAEEKDACKNWTYAI